MLSVVWNTFKRLKWLLIVIGILYVLSVAAGLGTSLLGPKTFRSYAERADAQSAEQVERIFGRFRQPVREGRLGYSAKDEAGA